MAGSSPAMTGESCGACASRLFRRGFDRRDVGIGETEMMADLMHQNMRDYVAEPLLVLGPIIEDGAAVEPYHIRQLAGQGQSAALRETAAGEKAQKVEFCFAIHRVEDVLVGEIRDLDHETLAKVAKFLRQARIGRRCDLFEIGERRGDERCPIRGCKRHAQSALVPLMSAKPDIKRARAAMRARSFLEADDQAAPFRRAQPERHASAQNASLESLGRAAFALAG